MYAMTLDPRRSHEHNPDCPMRLTLSPDGRQWMCADCGIAIMWTRVHMETGERRDIRETPIYDGLEPGALADRMGATLKQCHGRPPVSSHVCECEREHVAGMGSDPHEGGTR